MVTGAQELPSESMNPIIRECVSIASVTGDAHWIDIARHVFRQLPPRLRQEAEFNLQMVRSCMLLAPLREGPLCSHTSLFVYVSTVPAPVAQRRGARVRVDPSQSRAREQR